MNELTVADVLRHYGATTVPEGTGWRSMRCPFHGDVHASGRVNTTLNAYKCHGCDMSGDALKLIERKEELSYGDAIEFTRKVLGKGCQNISSPAHDKPKIRPLGNRRWKSILD